MQGRQVVNAIKFEAFKKVDPEQAMAIQDAFADVFADVCDDMESGGLPQAVQDKSIT